MNYVSQGDPQENFGFYSEVPTLSILNSPDAIATCYQAMVSGDSTQLAALESQAYYSHLFLLTDQGFFNAFIAKRFKDSVTTSERFSGDYFPDVTKPKIGFSLAFSFIDRG